MRLEEAKALYPGEWIVFHVFEEGDNPEGEVLLHNKDRRAFDRELLERGLTDVYIPLQVHPFLKGMRRCFRLG